MRTKSSADDQGAALFFKISGVVFWKKLGLGSDQAADSRYTDNTAMKMAGDGKIRAPFGILRKIDRIVGDEDIIVFRIRSAQYILSLIHI